MNLNPNQFSNIARTLRRTYPGSLNRDQDYRWFLEQMHQTAFFQRICTVTQFQPDELMSFVAQAEEYLAVMAEHQPRGQSNYQPSNGDEVLVFDGRLSVNDLLTPLALTMQSAVVIDHYTEKHSERQMVNVQFKHDGFLSKGHFAGMMYAA